MDLQLEQYEAARDTFAVRVGKRIRIPLNRWLAKQSLVGTQPFFQPEQLAGLHILKANWQAIRDEAMVVMAEDRENIPPLAKISPDHRRIAQNSAWKSFFFKGYGYRSEANCARCPKTAALIDQVPGVQLAFYSIFEPGTHVREHYGVTKAMLNVHLGLMIPPGPERCELRVKDQFRDWTPGEFLIFDETYKHEAWNESSEPRVVLFLQVLRPMRWPGRLLGKLFLEGIKRTSYVQDARKAIGAAAE